MSAVYTSKATRSQLLIRAIFAAILVIFFLASIGSLINRISEINGEASYVEMLNEDIPIDDIFELSKGALELLRNGEFSKQGLSTRGAQLVADYQDGDIPFDDWPVTASLPEAEIEALDYLCNYLGLDVSCGSDGFQAGIYIDYGIITIQYTQTPPPYPAPYIVKNLGDGYYSSILTWNYYAHSNRFSDSLAFRIGALVVSGSLLILYIVLLFLKPRKS